MFKTYIISLKDEHERYQSVVRELNESRISNEHIEWFEAWKGSEHRNDPRVVKLCKIVCSDHMIGCALSHIELAKYFLYASNDPYCLVLEDDVMIPDKETFVQDVQHIYATHSSSDIIRLFCQGICNDKLNSTIPLYMDGSTAAYILTRTGARKIAEMNVLYHIDIQFNRLNATNTQRVNTRDIGIHSSFYNRFIIFNQPIGFWSNQKIIGDLKSLPSLLIPFVYALYIYKYNRSIIHINVLLFVLAYMCTFPFFVIHCFQTYKCSEMSQLLGTLIPLCFIIYLSLCHSRMKTTSSFIFRLLMLFCCHLMLMFHIIYQFSNK